MKATLTLVLAAMLLLACGNQANEVAATTEEQPEVVAETTTEPGPPTAEVLARLAEADKVDGQEDMVVGKCAGCSLLMDGKAEHELTVGDYKMHFCSEHCQQNYAANPNEKIMALQIQGN